MVAFTTALAASLGLHAAEANCGVFSTEALRCVIADNTAIGIHRAGCNGAFELTTPGSTRNAFVPYCGGLNLEHYFDAARVSENRVVFFEPRLAPMTFRRIDDLTAELHQPPPPCTERLAILCP